MSFRFWQAQNDYIQAPLYVGAFFMKLRTLLSFFLLLAGSAGKAQLIEERQNEVKMNLLSLAVKTVSLQYERNLRPHLTVALGIRFSPMSSLPFRNQLTPSGGSDNSNNVVTEALSSIRLRNFALTPEVRCYFRRDGEARGFYGALFGRYSADGFTSTFRTENNSSATGYRDVAIYGGYRAASIGLMLGAKFRLSRTVMLDWWIAGPMYSSGTLSLDVVLGQGAISQEERNNIQQDTDRGITIGTLNLKSGSVNFREDGFSLKTPLAVFELRTGLAIGIRF